MIELKHSVIEVLQHRWWVGGVAMLVALVLTPIVRFIAYRTKTVDRPDDLLKPHARPVAYLGGIAMCLGVLAGLGGYIAAMPDLLPQWEALKSALGLTQFAQLRENPLWRLFAIALAAVVITIVGLLDDIRGLKPSQKVCGQAVAAAILVAGGLGDRIAVVWLSYLHLSTYMWVVLPCSVVMCLMIVVAACNATNLLDGLDGLCGGVTGIIALGFLGLAVWLAMWGRYPGTDELRVGLCLAMAGAVLGFLPYNIPPASIFMGDAGSMLLGFFVATMMALFCREGTVRWLLGALAVFALPILDTSLAVVRRILRGRSIFAGDRSHLYDQLVDRGMSVRQVVVLFYFLATVTAVVGVVLAIVVRGRHALLAYAILWVIIWVVFIKLGMVVPSKRSKPSEKGKPGRED